MTEFLRARADLLIPLAMVAIWLALQLWILPHMGVST